jgi:hypothetical protein
MSHQIVPPNRIAPASGQKDGIWEPPRFVPSWKNCHFDALQRDREEVSRFVWENHEGLELHPEAHTYVASVRPSHRISPDGAPVRETVAEYVQILTIEARELRGLDLRKPEGMPDDHPLRLYGGGALVLGEFGQLKFHVGNGVQSRSEAGRKRQSDRLDYLWEHGALQSREARARRFALLHRDRALASSSDVREAW